MINYKNLPISSIQNNKEIEFRFNVLCLFEDLKLESGASRPDIDPICLYIVYLIEMGSDFVEGKRFCKPKKGSK